MHSLLAAGASLATCYKRGKMHEFIEVAALDGVIPL